MKWPGTFIIFDNVYLLNNNVNENRWLGPIYTDGHGHVCLINLCSRSNEIGVFPTYYFVYMYYNTVIDIGRYK